MALWRQLARGLANLFDRTAADRDISDEVEHYLEQLTLEGVERGLTEADARRGARLELRGELQVREQVRGYGWENAVESFVADVRYALRRLRGSPGFSAVVVVTLALGIGGTTAIFGAVNPVLFATLPYPDADRIRMIIETQSDGSHSDATFGMYRGIAERSRSFAAFSVFRAWQPTLIGADRPERLEGQRVSARHFSVLGVRPARGRDFEDGDDRAGSERVVILSDALWRARFGGDAALVGGHITLDDDSYTVIGVMPAGFENVLAPAADVWTTLKYDMAEGRAWGHHLAMIGRFSEGTHPDEAAVELNVIGQQILREQRPPTYGDGVVWSAPSLQAHLTRGVRPALLAVLGAVALVLMIACVNVANLLLARGVNRADEFALRAALGAGRSRLIRQMLTESLLLAATGGVLGVAVALFGVRALAAQVPAELPRVGAIAIDPTMLLFAFIVTTLAGLAFGVVPALQAAPRQRRELHYGSRRTIGGRQRRIRSALVVVQVALALMLLAGSGLLLRSMQRLFAESPGFDAAGVMTMQIQATGHRFAEEGATTRFFADALDAVRRLPSVVDAALTSQLPLSGDFDVYGVHFESSPTQTAAEDRGAFRYAVTPNYLAVMGVPLRAGRPFDEEDRAGAPLVAIVNESFARRRFPGLDPIGQRLRIGPTDGPPYTIVGVVGDVKQMSLGAGVPDAVYTAVDQWRFEDNVLSIVIRAHGDVTALVPAVREAIWSVDRDQPIVRVAAMDELLAATAAQRRFALALFQLFAIVALVLAAAGIYGMLAGSVAERTREIGLRAAVGASRWRIVTLVVGQGMKLTVLGVAIGFASAAAASRLIESMLYGVSRLDPATYIGVAALLAAVALLACAAPASRAARIEPASTLRRD